MKRERATEITEQVLKRVADGGGWLDMIDELYVFGSYARGAPEPHDVDLDVEFTPTPDWDKHAIHVLAEGGDLYGPLERQVRAGLRGLQIGFNFRREHSERIDFEMTLLWQRGEPLEEALSRLHAIQTDPTAGRAERDSMLPAFEGVDNFVPRPLRAALVRLAETQAANVEQVVLCDAEVRDPVARCHINERWTATSPLRRAANAAVAFIEAHGGDPRAVHLAGRDVDKEDTPHFVDMRWRHASNIPYCLTEWGGLEWIEILNPTRTRPLVALRITPLDREALRATTWIL